MREPHVATEDHHEPGRYEIRLKGHLDNRWANRFENLSFKNGDEPMNANRQTTSVGQVYPRWW